MKKVILILSILALALSVNAGTSVVNVNFETDVASQFTVFGYGGATNPSDYNVNFSYDYSTWVPAAGQTGPTTIPKAPNSGTSDGTKALKIEVNKKDATGEAAAVSIFPTAASNLNDFVIKFDAWMSYNGGELGSTGGTEFFTVGGHCLGSQIEWPNATASSGFFWAMTGEGGATNDMRYFEGAGAAAPTAAYDTPNWFGTNAKEEAATSWLTFFPVPPYKRAGCIGHAWTVVEMMVQGTSVKIYMTPNGGTKTEVASFTVANSSANGYPMIGYMDIFSGVSDPLGDNFILIDNLSITNISKVEDWEKK